MRYGSISAREPGIFSGSISHHPTATTATLAASIDPITTTTTTIGGTNMTVTPHIREMMSFNIPFCKGYISISISRR
jgi:hypothetical protein